MQTRERMSVHSLSGLSPSRLTPMPEAHHLLQESFGHPYIAGIFTVLSLLCVRMAILVRFPRSRANVIDRLVLSGLRATRSRALSFLPKEVVAFVRNAVGRQADGPGPRGGCPRCSSFRACTEHEASPHEFSAASAAACPIARLAPKLLDDASMADFVREGLLVLPRDEALPPGMEAQIFERLDRLLEGGANPNPGNNVLAIVPELLEVIDSPTVRGALQSVLGDGYVLHGHRFCHPSIPGGDTQAWHKDAYASGFQRRQHRLKSPREGQWLYSY